MNNNNTKEKRCPKGSRRDPITKECVEIAKKDKENESKYHIEKQWDMELVIK